MSDAAAKSSKEPGMFMLDRREFLSAGHVVAATAMLPPSGPGFDRWGVSAG